MKKLFAFFFLLIFLIVFFLIKPRLSKAAVIPCDNGLGPCTYCNTDNNNACLIDQSRSTCSQYGYFPNSNYCRDLGGGCPSGPSDCVEASTCGGSGQSCAGDPAQGTCCNGLLCSSTSHTCETPAVCSSENGPCTGPPFGGQDGCCSGLVCEYKPGGNVTDGICQKPSAVTGYFCETSQSQCLPCYSNSNNTGCSPPQYTDPSACNSACKGQVTKKFNCDQYLGCVESQNGSFSDIVACQKSCNVKSFDVTCENGTGIKTAIGCIHALKDIKAFSTDILRWAIGIGSGIAFLFMLYAGFMIMTSAGNPERLKAGQELLTSAIAGLILLIFSVFVLNFIGVNILGIFKP